MPKTITTDRAALRAHLGYEKPGPKPGHGGEHRVLYPGEGAMKRMQVLLPPSVYQYIHNRGGSAYLRALAETDERNSRII